VTSYGESCTGKFKNNVTTNPFGQRQFSPPADAPEYEGANQKVMTPEEFYQSTEFLELDKHDRKAAKFTYYDLLDFAERYAEQSAPKWISVKERLPEFESDNCTYDVQVCFGGSYISREACYYDKRYCKWDFARTSETVTGEITHWQPLPAPPEK